MFRTHGIDAVHWSEIGTYSATDREILAWARKNQCVIFTNDLDFGAIIAATGADFPSVMQLRDLDITPSNNAEILIDVINRYSEQLGNGAIVSVDAKRSRVRILPVSE